MRKLASIQRIQNLTPIPDADAIEVAKVLGWNVVVKKDEFKIGDLVVYCEIDSVLPDKPEFEFLKNKKFRIRTVRLRGQVSQGICFPLRILPKDFEIVEDAECTTALEIIKYELPVPANLAGEMKGNFPSFIPKTDETRVQNLQKIITAFKGTACYISEKLDGTSATYYLRDGIFGVCSRNWELEQDDENTYWKMALQYDIEKKLKALNKNIALQGEMIGENIQKNKYGLNGNDVYFFNAYDIDANAYLNFNDFINLCAMLKLKTTPILNANYQLEDDIPILVKQAEIKSTLNNKIWAEGIVVRPIEETISILVSNNRFSFKAINPDFLLKYNDD